MTDFLLSDQKGMIKLAQIVKEARAGMSYRGFGEKIGVSHTSVQRLEGKLSGSKEIKDETLKKLAPLTKYTYEELRAIVTGNACVQLSIVPKSPEDILAIAEKTLSREDLIKLNFLLLNHLLDQPHH
jgi:transcriptional regulator with XRE-family HTH domain